MAPPERAGTRDLARGLAVYARVADPRWLFGAPRGLIVYAQGRSGSTLLGDLLDSHPDIVYRDEILYEPVRFPRTYVTAQRARHPRAAYAFHVKPYQLSQEQRVTDQGRWLRSMTRLGWRIVHLRRTNLVHQVLSNVRAQATGTYHARTPGERLGPIEVDPANVLEYVRARAATWEIEDQALDGLAHVSLTYEDDLLVEPARQPALERVFDHLGIRRVPVTTTLQRLGADRLEDLVSNADDLRAALADTPYASMVAGG